MKTRSQKKASKAKHHRAVVRDRKLVWLQVVPQPNPNPVWGEFSLPGNLSRKVVPSFQEGDKRTGWYTTPGEDRLPWSVVKGILRSQEWSQGDASMFIDEFEAAGL